ncbi:MAG: urocanate hydratase, partial [Acidimicrobiales bacterium]
QYYGGSVLVVEVDEQRARRRQAGGWVDEVTSDYHEALRRLDRATTPTAVGLVGNIAEVAPRLVADGVHFDVATDQTAAHDLRYGYVPVGYTPAESRGSPGDAPEYADAVERSLAAHLGALLALRDGGAVVFEYGNNLREQGVRAGVLAADDIPGFVSTYVRPILSQGVGPFRWICLTGEPDDLRRTEDVVLEVAGTPGMERWFQRARHDLVPQGLPARICWLGLGQRHEVGLAVNRLVRDGRVGPVALGRDHMDPASVSSPSRETEAMLDGSDAIADWPILSALLNAAQGATWVAVGNGGGVGVGRSIHSGMVVVADGSLLAERKIARVFWSDPALGVARYADAGYPAALEGAAQWRLDLPSAPAGRAAGGEEKA